MTLPGVPDELTNWSKSSRSACIVFRAGNTGEILQALEFAQTRHLSVIPHGAGHSYTDAALNTSGVVLDLTPMARILAWDAVQGIMRVEPGVPIRKMVQTAWKDGWWPAVSPSTAEATIGGCAAMNVNGRNAWKCGPFGEHILSLDVLLANGETRTIVPRSDGRFFQALVGSMGLLGILTSITVQLERITSGFVTIQKRPAGSLDQILALFDVEQEQCDTMEAWIDGFARGKRLGRGILTGAKMEDRGGGPLFPFQPDGDLPDHLGIPLINFAAALGRPVLKPGIQTANRIRYWRGQLRLQSTRHAQALIPYTYWPAAAFDGYQAAFPDGVETFQAFVPGERAQEIFKQVLRFSQDQEIIPIWCIIKRHRRDEFLLSYQVDGFSLELNYQRTSLNAQTLKKVLQRMIAIVIEAGGKFYLAKDHFMTSAQYRQSVGGEAVDAFLKLKHGWDPAMILQSDLFRRIFEPSGS